MKPEIGLSESEHHDFELGNSRVNIRMDTFSPDTAWVKALIRNTNCPIYSLYLPGSKVVAGLTITNTANGASCDVVERIYGYVDVIRLKPEDPDDHSPFCEETGRELTIETATWLRLLSTHFSSMPRARAIDVGVCLNLGDIVAALHEVGHVTLGHTEGVDDTYVGGIRELLSQEHEASVFALNEFVSIAQTLDLPQTEVDKAKRLLDVFYYTYVIGFENKFGKGKFDGIREIDLDGNDIDMVRAIFDWLVNLYCR